LRAYIGKVRRPGAAGLKPGLYKIRFKGKALCAQPQIGEAHLSDEAEVNGDRSGLMAPGFGRLQLRFQPQPLPVQPRQSN